MPRARGRPSGWKGKQLTIFPQGEPRAPVPRGRFACGQPGAADAAHPLGPRRGTGGFRPPVQQDRTGRGRMGTGLRIKALAPGPTRTSPPGLTADDPPKGLPAPLQNAGTPRPCRRHRPTPTRPKRLSWQRWNLQVYHGARHPRISLLQGQQIQRLTAFSARMHPGYCRFAPRPAPPRAGPYTASSPSPGPPSTPARAEGRACAGFRGRIAGAGESNEGSCRVERARGRHGG